MSLDLVTMGIHVPSTPETLGEDVARRLKNPAWRFGHMAARALPDRRLALDVLLLDTERGETAIFTAELSKGQGEYPAVTPHVPAAHWAERAIGEMFGVRATGHPRWKSLRLHNPAWPDDLFPLRPDEWDAAPSRPPYTFMRVKGEGIHEIPVGPIHAGIIEPGHFRFSCVGEIVTNLEIRLGFQHRGLEERLAGMPWRAGRFLAEAASTDTAVGNALAHAVAIERMQGISAPPRAQALRTVALEIERLANHLGDLGALAGDVGYNIGPALFPPMRAQALGMGQTLTGTRLQRQYIRPGGVARDLHDARRKALLDTLSSLEKGVRRNLPLILDNPGVRDRMEGTGRLSPSLARDFGLVGPAGRASGSRYDARCAFAHGVYPGAILEPAHHAEGDVLARTRVRADEIAASMAIIRMLLESLPESPVSVPLGDRLPSGAVGIGIVEAWRGELIHWITTDADGRITRYAIKDPSFNNWTGLAVAMRGNLVADFPLCNKSFNLSYSGNDL